MSNDFKVIINGQNIDNGQKIIFEKSQDVPKPIFDIGDNEYYTIAMVDPDAPSRENPIYKYFLHMLIVNNYQTLVSFQPPSPPKGSGYHRYFFFLLKQPKYIDQNIWKQQTNNNSIRREKFNLSEFISDNKLTVIASTYFKTKR
ncbi:Phosphatidylethanolamine-binding protein [Acanthamoeba polyphaga mimivirus]|uniref:Phosphatidylethanolamine-binding protein n=1 Tax=Acanthamoeba polyphaga mimivirus TaxID=212035 RepID=A0A0G2Y4E6_MIMIV|nr:phosphatidylethanolamine-binding protein [Acanthamoeba castellanii mamavirus]AKI79424.1 phosphatidylethanolamine-binding protein [Acanthamoeba polyphaga mimivirus]UMZ07815.1 Phosphatidylethanolamine-binding protein [Acanthamoeba polyphaga mimivirus]